MQYDEFVDLVQRRAGLDQRDPAWDLTCRGLETLAECLSADTAGQLADQLPEELQACVRPDQRGDGEAGAFDLAEFARRVAQRVGYEPAADEALAHSGAVLRTLREAVAGNVWADVAAELPDDYSDAL